MIKNKSKKEEILQKENKNDNNDSLINDLNLNPAELDP